MMKRISKAWRIGRLKTQFEWKSKDHLWGRFGGGWNWELGFQAGGRTVIVNLLIASVRFSIDPKALAAAAPPAGQGKG